jgi:hypothetical protein
MKHRNKVNLSFHYRPSHSTNVLATFRKEQARLKALKAAQDAKVLSIKERKHDL